MIADGNKIEKRALNELGTEDVDLFVFAGQSNMMGAAILAPTESEFTDKALEYKYVPRLRGREHGLFVPAQNPAGEFHYKDLNAAYGDRLQDLDYRSDLTDYGANTYFCPAMRNGEKAFADQSERESYPSSSIPPYFVTEYAKYGHSSVYAHIAKGAVCITHYFTEEMKEEYNTLIADFNAKNATNYMCLPSVSGGGAAFDEKYMSMEEDYSALVPESTIKNKCFLWLQGENDGADAYAEHKLKLSVLWSHLRKLGFTHFFVFRVGYWGNMGIINVMKAQEDFCAENDNCHIVTRAPSLISHPALTTDNWWKNEPSEEYEDCRDAYLVSGNANWHFNEKAVRLFAKRSAENIHRILYLGLDSVLEEENIKGMLKTQESL